MSGGRGGWGTAAARASLAFSIHQSIQPPGVLLHQTFLQFRSNRSNSVMFKQVTLTNKCLAIVIQRCETSNHHRSPPSRSSAPENGFQIFQQFQEENRGSFWNPGLVQSVNALEFVGFVRPGTMFVSGSELHLECLRGAWARRVLKPPPGFTIKRLGDIGGIEMQEVPQTQFIPLPEVLCLIVSNLNRVGKPATLTEIVTSLTEEYEGMCIPKQEVLYATLGALIAEGKLYCMGEHYFVPTPTMFHYYQQQFLRRTAVNPPNYLWTKENDPNRFPQKMNNVKTQETCSRECQTGASVVGGQSPYVPPNRKDQATSVQTQNTDHPSANTNGRTDTKTQANKENKGFLARLFGRTKPKQPSSKTPTVQLSSPTEFPSTSATIPGQQCPTDSAPMATFSAQFPPPEWLCDSRFVKAANTKESTQQQFQQPFLAKIRRTSKEQPQNVGTARHSVWVDPIVDAGHGKTSNSNFNRRERSNDTKRCFASQRYDPKNHYGHHSPADNYDRYHRSGRQRHRLSKFLSSSSECLRESPPSHSQNKKSVEADERRRNGGRHHSDRFKSHQHYSVYQFPNTHQHQLSQKYSPRGEHPGEKMEKGELDERKEKATLEVPVQAAVVVVSRMAPLALHAETEFDCDAQRSSTPTAASTKEHGTRPVVESGHGEEKENGQAKQGRGNRDSAYSASPVVTEMSSSEGKYSSWSGSDGQRENEASTSGPKSADQDRAILLTDNTYVNDTQTRKCALDHTYENLDHAQDGQSKCLNGTKYEDLSDDPRESPTDENVEPKSASPRFSAVSSV